jgi:hypothetical protein
MRNKGVSPTIVVLLVYIIDFVTKGSFIGTSLRVNHVRCVAFKVVEAAGINHLFILENRLLVLAGQVEGMIQLVTEDTRKSIPL